MIDIFEQSFDFDRPLSLYVHVPFCIRKCSYCAFFSCTGQNEEIRENYTDRIVSEIEKINQKLKTPFHTVFIGGGNPGCLSYRQLERICKAACKNGRPEEFTTEMNPESLDENKCSLFADYFTRLSMGVQSLDEKALKFLGRNASLKETIKGMENACTLREETGISLNFDLITCLGKWHDALADVRKTVGDFSPDHLSIYALSIEEGTPLYRQNVTVPDSDEQFEILSGIWKFMKDRKYVHYEVSNFAEPGHECMHNIVYWDYSQYAGVGPGAASTGFRDGLAYRIEADCNIANWKYNMVSLSVQEQLEEFVLMGLRHSKGLDLERLERYFGKTITEIPDGYSKKGGFLVPDEHGLITSDAAALQIISKLG